MTDETPLVRWRARSSVGECASATTATELTSLETDAASWALAGLLWEWWWWAWAWAAAAALAAASEPGVVESRESPVQGEGLLGWRPPLRLSWLTEKLE